MAFLHASRCDLHETRLGAQFLNARATCIAHEILHLFGGWDLYKTFQTSEEQEKEARIQFPNSVMLRTSYDVSDVEIDPLTAWRIGWSEQPTGAYFFQPTHSE